MTISERQDAAHATGGRSRPRRLLMVVHGSYPVGEPRVAREAAVARAAGFQVDVVATRRPGERARERVDGVDVVRLPVSHRRGGGFAAVLWEYVAFTALATVVASARTLRRRYDVVQVHNPPDFLVATALLPKLLGCRVVLDIHDLAPDMFEMRFAGRRGADAALALLRAMERAATSVADAVITVHEPYRRELTRRGVVPAKLTVVMNALDERLLPASPGPPAPGFRVVYHGTFSPAYGLDLLVEAFAELRARVPGARLELYGEGDLAGALRRRGDELGLDGSLWISDGYLPHREVLAAVAGASVGVVPNLPIPLNRYALSSKLFEYVALGIPVVSAELPTIREHFSPEEVRYFPPGDARGLAAALLEVAVAPEAARERSRAAAERAAEYRWAVSADRYLRLLRG